MKEWKRKAEGKLTKNNFNAVKINETGILSLELTELNHPILHLRGFIDFSKYQQKNSTPSEYLDSNLIDLSRG